jgi:hypothetical protein
LRSLGQTRFLLLAFSYRVLFLACLIDRLLNEISNDIKKKTSISIVIMRRHSLDPDSIRRQIKSVFTSPTRKLFNFTNNNHNNNSIINFGRRSRRYSVPDKKHPDQLDINVELHTIPEVSKSI